MFEKVKQKTWKIVQNWFQMVANIEKKSIENGIQKSVRKMDATTQRPGGVGGWGGTPLLTS